MLKLEEGKYYRTRDGRKVGPMVHLGDTMAAYNTEYGMGNYWWLDGRRDKTKIREVDLVAEWVEETTMDIYSLEKPLGMYPYEIRDALYAHAESGGKVQSWGGWGWAFCEEPAFNPNLSYRAVKKPKVVEALFFLNTKDAKPSIEEVKTLHDTHKITFNIVDGVPDCNSIRMEKL